MISSVKVTAGAARTVAVRVDLTGIAMCSSMERSRFNNPQPAIRLQASERDHRRMSMIGHIVAALVEARTNLGAMWVVNVETSDDRGWVWLELSTASDDEATLGLATLSQVLGELQ